WAWAIMHAGKDVENRTWTTPYRGRLRIHAGLKVAEHGPSFLAGLGIEMPDDLPLGAIVGDVELVDIVEGASSPWARPGMYHWLLADPRPYDEPILHDGQRRLFYT